MDLTVDDDPDPRDVALLEQRVAEKTARSTGRTGDAESQLAIFVRADDGAIIAGVYGWTWGGWAELQHLWVDGARRGYELVGRVDDYPIGDAALWFRKALDPGPPTS